MNNFERSVSERFEREIVRFEIERRGERDDREREKKKSDSKNKRKNKKSFLFPFVNFFYTKRAIQRNKQRQRYFCTT